jgi:hypothetical protein
MERKRLSRKKMLPWFANGPPALVGMVAFRFQSPYQHLHRTRF